MDPLLTTAGDRLGAYHERLAQLVAVDSGSGQVDGLREAADLVQTWCLAAGLAVEREPVADPSGSPLGDVLVARRRGRGERRILLAGHLDTVFPPGTAATRPFRVHDGRAYGPGVCDDKGGLLSRARRRRGADRARPRGVRRAGAGLHPGRGDRLAGEPAAAAYPRVGDRRGPLPGMRARQR
ncbi:M20/M25/M40 family metallo-hydrolase [Micromonospora sp. 4G55]|uniref:M20/M25/M40 family metallo-hydrolase n=1 Tax=Micromonospora sp. 4G55 TaxID=2806102 RepID=UPI00272E244C|nr:M20/M25/M40 family metallo-hydrolase [Micromonospora sp. 4G55]